MIVYTVMIERRVCLNDPPCRVFFKCEHEKVLDWQPQNRLTEKVSICTGALTRWLKDWHHYLPQREKNGLHQYPETGNAMVVQIDTKCPGWKPYLNDAEQAAFKIGGWESVKRGCEVPDGLVRRLSRAGRAAAPAEDRDRVVPAGRRAGGQ